MRIKSIRISGFNNIFDKTIEFENINYLNGPNGAGKSTVLQAVQLALLGYLPTGRKNNKESIYRHANGLILSVTLTLDDGATVKREWFKVGSTIHCSETVSPEGYNTAALLSGIELPIFNFTEFIGQSANKLKDWFIAFLPDADDKIDWHTELTQPKLLANVPEHDREIFQEVIHDAESQFCNISSDDSSEIREANSICKNKISAYKDLIARANHTIQSLIYYDDVADDISIEAVDAQLKELRQIAEEYAANKNAAAQVAEITSKINGYALSAACAEDDPEYHILTELIDSYDAEIREIQQEAITAEQISAAEHAFHEADYKYTQLKSRIDTPDMCPYTCQSCEKLTKYSEDASAELALTETDRADAKRKWDDMITASRATQSAIASVDAKKLEAVQKRFKLFERYAEVARLRSMIQDIPQCDIDIDQVRQQISELEDVKVKLKANEQYNALLTKLTATKCEDEARLSIWKMLEKHTGVNGMQSNKGADSPFARFEDALNQYIPKLFGDSCKAMFNIESKANSFSFGLRKNGSYISYDMLSSGEKCMYTLALMLCIVKESDALLKLILVDDLFDHLDTQNITALFNVLKTVDDVQFIFAGVPEVNNVNVIEM